MSAKRHTPIEVNDFPVALYRLYDIDGTLLYIGISGYPKRRWQQHAGEKPWWASVHRKTVQVFPDRSTAEAAERDAIIRERPLHNMAHVRHVSNFDITALSKMGLRRMRLLEQLAEVTSNIRAEIVAADASGANQRGIAEASDYTRDMIRQMCLPPEKAEAEREKRRARTRKTPD